MQVKTQIRELKSEIIQNDVKNGFINIARAIGVVKKRLLAFMSD